MHRDASCYRTPTKGWLLPSARNSPHHHYYCVVSTTFESLQVAQVTYRRDPVRAHWLKPMRVIAAHSIGRSRWAVSHMELVSTWGNCTTLTPRVRPTNVGWGVAFTGTGKTASALQAFAAVEYVADQTPWGYHSPTGDACVCNRLLMGGGATVIISCPPSCISTRCTHRPTPPPSFPSPLLTVSLCWWQANGRPR
jgi:hypothetical protein